MNKVSTKQELIIALTQHSDDLRQFGIKRLGIFGSFAKGAVTEGSDVDLLIEFNPDYKTLRNFVALADFLQTLLGRKVEIVTPQSLNPFIGKYITKEVEYVTLAA